jgi:hypothetical protein
MRDHEKKRRESSGELGRSRSRPKQSNWIVIAQGEEGYQTWWHDDFEPVMHQIDRHVNAIGVYQLDLDWEEICDRVPYLKDKPWDICKDRPWKDYWENLEYTMDCAFRDEIWDDGMPGQSGHFFTLKLKLSQKKSFLETMGQLRASLAKYWEEHQLPGP